MHTSKKTLGQQAEPTPPPSEPPKKRYPLNLSEEVFANHMVKALEEARDQLKASGKLKVPSPKS